MGLTVRDRILFFRAFLRSPSYVGGLIPSSSHLARAMVRPLDFGEARLIVELGAGSGVLTEQILRSCFSVSPAARVLVFERDDAMRKRLEEKYPNLELFSEALDIAGIVNSSCDRHVDAVVCSLPFANFPRATRAKLAQDIHTVLRPHGNLIAVQYSLQMRRALRSLFGEVGISFVPLNLPPAFVYTCTKLGPIPTRTRIMSSVTAIARMEG